MGVLLVLLSALMWSFVAVLVKTVSLAADSFTIAFARFFFGIIILGLFIWLRQGKLTIHWKSRWIWYGAIGKVINYIFEILGISIGYAFSQILVMPMIMIFMMIFSVFYFKEKATIANMLAGLVCIAGILLVSWNGQPIDQLLELNLLITGLLAISALGACFHFASQKILIKSMNSEQMNFTVFVWAALFTAIPLPMKMEISPTFNLMSLMILIALGAITSISFYIYALGLQRVSFMTASILGNASILFTLVWSWLFLGEPVTVYIILGAILFIAGMILVNLPSSEREVQR